MCSMPQTGEELNFSSVSFANTEQFTHVDNSFIILHLCLLAAIKIEDVTTFRYGEVVLLVKICDILKQLGLLPVVREGSRPSCSLLQMASFSFASRQTRISLKYC